MVGVFACIGCDSRRRIVDRKLASCPGSDSEPGWEFTVWVEVILLKKQFEVDVKLVKLNELAGQAISMLGQVISKNLRIIFYH